jgi:anaerobic magnesium-protoporphyrin IX monomethyl ester cyclase
MQAQHYRNLGHRVVWDHKGAIPLKPGDKIISAPEDINFIHLPHPDRVWTNSFDKKYQDNGNFKYHPGTYIQVADGCWHGKCTFCVERNREWRVRPIWDVNQELESIKRLGFKEVFDDSGSFPMGEWLDRFLMLPNPGVVMGCNCRMAPYPWQRMKDWGFRMVLFGLESANQKTLDKINKGVKVEDIKHIEAAAKAGLDCHGAFIFGFPWETDDEAISTLKLAHDLLRSGTLKTAQASFYDVEGRAGKEDHRKYVGRLYQIAKSPQFWINKISNIKSKEDLRYFFRQIKAGLFNG